MTIDWLHRASTLTLGVSGVIDGRRHDGCGPILEKFGPRDGGLLYRFSAADTQDVEVAVASARRSFADGRWAKLPVQRRKAVLHKLASLIDEHREELALLECLEAGKPIRDALEWDVPTTAAIVRFHAEAADKCFGSVYSGDATNLSYQLRRPVGVVAGIVGWNFPLVLAATKVAPALATGNSLILKPSELTSLSAVRLAELALEVGVPEGVFNVVPGAAAAGAALAHHSEVDLITFTGSTATGKRLLVAAGQSNMKRMVLECGGKAANIVFEDAPKLEAVAEGLVARAFWNQGQVCTASSRLLVQDRIREQLIRLVIEKTSRLTFGDPLSESTAFGAVVSQEHQRKVEGYIVAGEEGGARLAYRSTARPPYKDGFYVPPVIFEGVSPDHRIAREEIFGPVLSVLSFRDEEEAIRLANETSYGLSAIVWTTNLARAHRMSQGIQAGWITVNATENPTGGPGEGELPVGGHKQSGIGVEGGVEGLQAYTSQTAVQLFV